MKTLIIADLASTQELDHGAMHKVRGGFGGYKMGSAHYPLGDVTYAPRFDSSINAAQTLNQAQEVMLATANGSAFLGGVHVDSDVSQHGENKIVRN
jgi:hypothetical protein